MSNFLIRQEAFIGTDATEKLKQSHVAVFGLGGVGGHAAEALCRAGVGTISLIDAERFDLSNCNRQLFATQDTVGILKTAAAKDRLSRIAPDCKIICYPIFFGAENVTDHLFDGVDIILDAMDTLKAKIDLARCAKERGIAIISCMGTGNKLDPTAFRIGDLYQTKNCPLARRMRKLCRKCGINSLPVVYSEEEAPRVVAQTANGRHAPGSISFVPGAAGLAMASWAVRKLIS